MSRRSVKRSDDLSKKESINESLLKKFRCVQQAFIDQNRRSEMIMDHWDAYHCKLGPKQFYRGESQKYIPIIRDAVNAVRTRQLNQLFPKSGRYVEEVTSDQDRHYALLSLLESYVVSSRLRTEVLPSLLVNGQIEGQYTVYARWLDIDRNIAYRKQADPATGMPERVVEEEFKIGRPAVDVISDCDLMVIPTTVDSIEHALAVGGSATVIWRWTKDQLWQHAEDGDISKENAEIMEGRMSRFYDQVRGLRDTSKEMVDAAGIKKKGKEALVYEMFTMEEVNGKNRMVRAFYGGNDLVLGAKLNPYWCDRCPIISQSVLKVHGRFKGDIPVQPCMDVQIMANDALNECADSIHYALGPVTAVNPEVKPDWTHLIYRPGAVWPVEPDAMKTFVFPDTTPSALRVIEYCRTQIFQTLGVNPAMMPQQTGRPGAKRNQAEIALEQQVDLLTTSEAVTVVEQGILTPLMQRFAEYDHQFRDYDMMVRSYGELGHKSELESVGPMQAGRNYQLRWYGVESSRNQAQVQQMIAGMNVLAGIPPQLYQGYQMTLAPALEHLVGEIYGPRLGPLLFRSTVDQMSVPPETENKMLAENLEVLVHLMDNHSDHIRAHMQVPAGPQRDVHIQRHMQMLQAQQAAAITIAQQGGGGSGNGQAGPQGGPQRGSMVGPQRPMRQPPGTIHQDRMPGLGAIVPPRKT